MSITKGWNLPENARSKADPSTWYASYPNPADLNFDYRKLLDGTASTGIASNTNSTFKIAIVGAGVAGLTAARELLRCGFTNIDLYEATDRYGGRHYTKTISTLTTSDMQYTVQEGGAMRMPFFLPDGETSPENGESMLAYYLNEFDIATEGFPNPGSDYANTGIYYNEGYASGESEPTMLLWKKGVSAPPTTALQAVNTKWNTFVASITAVVKEKYPTSDWPSFWQDIVTNYWDKTFRDVVLEDTKTYSSDDPGNWGGVGMTEDEAKLFYIIGAGDGSWGAFFNLSFLYVYRTFIHGFSDSLYLIQGLFDDDGNFNPGPYYGTDTITDSSGNTLPNPAYLGVKCFDDCLMFEPVTIPGVTDEYSLYTASKNSDDFNVNLYFNTPVTAIRKFFNIPVTDITENDAPNAGHTGAILTSDVLEDKYYDAVIITVPTWQFGTQIQVNDYDTTTEWPFDLQTYLKRAHWEPCAKIFVGLTEAYWENSDCKIPQCIATDTFLQDIYGVKVSQGGSEQTGTLLLSYTWWRDANKLVCYDDDKLIAMAIVEADRILLNCKNIQQAISPYIDAAGGYVIHWEKQPTYKGAARLYDENTWEDTQVPMAYNQVYSASTNLYFAGESYSVDAGWTEPALRGAIDAILHLCNNNGFDFNDSTFDFDTDYPEYDMIFDPNS